MPEKRYWTTSNSTLRELRQIVERTSDMPADAEVRVRTRFGANGEGSLVRDDKPCKKRGRT